MASPLLPATKTANQLLSHETSQSPDLESLKQPVASGLETTAFEFPQINISGDAQVQLQHHYYFGEIHGSDTDGNCTCEDVARTLACPFWTNDPLSHDSCSTILLGNSTSLKQHLYSRHTEPEYYCPRCFATFTSHSKLKAHLRDEQCSKIATSPFQGLIDCDQMRFLEQVKDGCATQHWNHIYKILFPGQEHPNSPYLGDQRDQVTVGHLIALFKACPDMLHHLQPGVDSTNAATISTIPLGTRRLLHQAMDKIGRLPDAIADQNSWPSEQSGQLTMEQSANKLAARAECADQNLSVKKAATDNDIPITTSHGGDHGDFHSLHANEGSSHYTVDDASGKRQIHGQVRETTTGLQQHIAACTSDDVPQHKRPRLASNASSEGMLRYSLRGERSVRGTTCCVRCGMQGSPYEFEISEEGSQTDCVAAAPTDGNEAFNESAGGASTNGGSLACNLSKELGSGMPNTHESSKRKRMGSRQMLGVVAQKLITKPRIRAGRR